MFCRTGLVAIVALLTLTVYPPAAQVGGRDPQPPGAAVKAAPAPRPSVTLQHQLIQVTPAVPADPVDPGALVAPVAPTKRPKPPSLRRALPSTRLAYGPGQQESIGVRARRAFLGDGRFRPEPFPRLDR